MTGIVNNKGIAAFLLCVALQCCTGPSEEPRPVDAVVTVEPVSGTTLTRFVFDAQQSFILADDDHPVVIRFDWQDDGIWDLGYSTRTTETHRFLSPGKYTVRMEARNLSGERDTVWVTVSVEQGYSPPFARLEVQPDTANLYTDFQFSAAASYDDEEPVEKLVFRWDFDGDGRWDLPYSSESTTIHRYLSVGNYIALVEVMDPTGRSATATKPVVINRINKGLFPVFTVDCGFCTLKDSFRFDASGSRYPERPEAPLTYSWDIGNDNIWEATNLTTSSFEWNFREEGRVKIRLRVRDDQELYRDTVELVDVFPENTPPVPVLVIGNRVGNTQTNYYAHGLGTYDRESSVLDLKYEWDTNGDGSWEPVYDNQREINFRYSQTGKHLVRLRVTDSHANAVVAEDTVTVYPGTHETGLMVDKRNFIPEYYATVKIGSLWWMQENIRVEIIPGPGGKPAPLVRWNYGSKPSLSQTYGGLYSYKMVRYPICPDGWRLPTRAEFEEMIRLEAPNSLSQLWPGASSEMHIYTAGYIDLNRRSIGFGSTTNFWLADVSNAGLPYAWYMDKSKGESRPVLTSEGYGYSVRCVKND